MGKGEAFKFCCKIVRNDDSKPVPVLDIIEEKIDRCKYALPALADTKGADEFTNDVFSVYFKFSESNSSTVLKLYKCDEEVKTLNNDDYGTFYPFGFHQNDGKKYIGYKIEWHKILIDTDLGEGDYYVKAESITVTGRPAEQQSFVWCLQTYLSRIANNTTRLEWIHNGIIGDWEKDDETYSFDNWYGGLRIPNSIVYNEGVEKEVRERQFKNGLYQDVKRESVPVWDYSIEQAPWFLHRYLSVDVTDAEEIRVTDYNFRNPIKNIIDKNVKIASSYEPEWNNYGSSQGAVVFKIQQKQNRFKKLFC